MTVDELIRELLATGRMNEDTVADLNRMLAESAAGTLDPDDADYVRALHARETGTTAPAAEFTDAGAAPTLDGLDLAGWRDRALAAEAELAALKAQAASQAS